MDFFPPEIATPPLALVALLGCPDLHGIVGEFLRAAHKPPINSLGIAEPAMAARLFGEGLVSVSACCAFCIAKELMAPKLPKRCMHACMHAI